MNSDTGAEHGHDAGPKAATILAPSRGEAVEVSVRGLVLRGLAFGPPSGRPVLAVHGWLDNAHSFAPLAAHLPACRVVALDMPGHGLSDPRAADAEYHIIDYVQDVLGALAALGWQEASLMGHSMGACIASLVAGSFPERVTSLVLLDGIGPLTDPPEEAPARLRRHILEAARLARKAPRSYASYADFAAQLRRVVPNLSEASSFLLAARGCRCDPATGVTQRADMRLRGTSGPRMSEPQVLAFLANIRSPCLLVRAADGFLIDLAQLAGRTAAVADLRAITLAGGHHVHMESPAEVAAALRTFWRQTEASGRET